MQLSFAALLDVEMIGSVRLTRISIGGADAMLLGPLAVAPKQKGRGAGRRLMRRGMDAALAKRVGFVLLVGDSPYYRDFGFEPAPRGSIIFPAPVDPARILLADLRADRNGLPAGEVVAGHPLD